MQMNVMIDQELEKIDKKHAALIGVNSQLTEALKMYHSLMKDTYPLAVASGHYSANYMPPGGGGGQPTYQTGPVLYQPQQPQSLPQPQPQPQQLAHPPQSHTPHPQSIAMIPHQPQSQHHLHPSTNPYPPHVMMASNAVNTNIPMAGEDYAPIQMGPPPPVQSNNLNYNENQYFSQGFNQYEFQQ